MCFHFSLSSFSLTFLNTEKRFRADECSRAAWTHLSGEVLVCPCVRGSCFLLRFISVSGVRAAMLCSRAERRAWTEALANASGKLRRAIQPSANEAPVLLQKRLAILRFFLPLLTAPPSGRVAGSFCESARQHPHAGPRLPRIPCSAPRRLGTCRGEGDGSDRSGAETGNSRPPPLRTCVLSRESRLLGVNATVHVVLVRRPL